MIERVYYLYDAYPYLTTLILFYYDFMIGMTTLGIDYHLFMQHRYNILQVLWDRFLLIHLNFTFTTFISQSYGWLSSTPIYYHVSKDGMYTQSLRKLNAWTSVESGFVKVG